MSKTRTKISLRNNGFVCAVSSIMAGDSPTSDYKDTVFTYPPGAAAGGGRSTPPPTTSYLSGKQDTGNPAVATEIIPDLSRKDEVDGHRELEVLPDANYKMVDGGKPPVDQTRQDDKGSAKMNGGGDKLDGTWVMPLPSEITKSLPPKDEDKDEEDSCMVNCLYYTMQCCECTIS